MKNEELVALVALLDSFQAKLGFIENRLQLTLCIRPTADSEDEHAVSVVDTGPLNAATFTILYHSASGKEIWQKKGLQKTSLSCRKRSGAGMPYRNGFCDFALVLSSAVRLF